MSDLDENKALVRRYFEEFFNQRTLDSADEVCARSTWNTPPRRSSTRNRAR